MQIAQIHGDRAEQADEEPQFPFRVQFTTPVVKPVTVPTFAYVSSKVNFDSIMYTAILRGPNMQAIIREVRSYWPDAETQLVEQGVAGFTATDTTLMSVQFGAERFEPKPSRSWKIWR